MRVRRPSRARARRGRQGVLERGAAVSGAARRRGSRGGPPGVTARALRAARRGRRVLRRTARRPGGPRLGDAAGGVDARAIIERASRYARGRVRGRRAGGADHARPRPARQRDHGRSCCPSWRARVERADLDPAVHVILLAGAGKGFCGGYDLVESAEGEIGPTESGALPGSPLHPLVIKENHSPRQPWDPMLDHATMSRNVRAFMSLHRLHQAGRVQGPRVLRRRRAGLALCSDLLVIAADAKIGYPPARVWGSPTTAMWAYRLGPQRAKRLLFTGDSLSGAEALEWGLAMEAPLEDEVGRACGGAGGADSDDAR